jgi:hypothetical protein
LPRSTRARRAPASTAITPWTGRAKAIQRFRAASRSVRGSK